MSISNVSAWYLAAAGVLLASAAAGAPDAVPPNSGPSSPAAAAGSLAGGRIRIGAEAAWTRGAGAFDISFRGTDPGGILPVSEPVRYTGRSRLEWEGIDALVCRIRGAADLTRAFGIEGSYAWGTIPNGDVTDTDWISAPSVGVNDFVLSESTADAEGDIRSWEINLIYRLDDLTRAWKLPFSCYLLGGYQYYADELSNRGGVQTIIDEESVSIPFSEVGAILDSTYDFTWKAFRAGGGGEWPIGRAVAIAGRAALLLGVDYRGEGYWNLREDFRAQSPNFVHESTAGWGADGRLALEWRPASALVLRAGYEQLWLRAEAGKDTTYFADGSTGTASLDEVTSSRGGPFAGAEYRF